MWWVMLHMWRVSLGRRGYGYERYEREYVEEKLLMILEEFNLYPFRLLNIWCSKLACTWSSGSETEQEVVLALSPN